MSAQYTDDDWRAKPLPPEACRPVGEGPQEVPAILRQRSSWTPIAGDGGVEGDNSLLVALDDPNAQVPKIQHGGDAGYDLAVSQAVLIYPDTFVDVHCGIRLQLPVGTWARLTGRSSTLRKRGLLVNEAVIDNGYTGSIYIGVWNMTAKPVRVQVGDRLAQLILHPIVRVPVTGTEQELASRDGRSHHGFGSTGT